MAGCGRTSVAPAGAIDAEKNVIHGFRAMYRFLAARTRELLAKDGPIERLASHRVRVAHRSTSGYGAALQRWLRSGRGSAPAAPRGEPWLSTERRSLARLDIPRLYTHPASTDLETVDGKRVPGWFVVGGLERARRRLGALSPADLDARCQIIRASLALTAVARKLEPSGGHGRVGGGRSNRK